MHRQLRSDECPLMQRERLCDSPIGLRRRVSSRIAKVTARERVAHDRLPFPIHANR